MVAHGANPEQLETLAHSMDAAAARLDHIADALGARVAHTAWRGPSAERFRHDWITYRAHMRQVAATLREAHGQIANQVRQQREASAPRGGAAGAAQSFSAASATARFAGRRLSLYDTLH